MARDGWIQSNSKRTINVSEDTKKPTGTRPAATAIPVQYRPHKRVGLVVDVYIELHLLSDL